MKAWVNGELVPQEQVQVSLLSHSFSRGSAIFETFDVTETARGPALFRPDAHPCPWNRISRRHHSRIFPKFVRPRGCLCPA